MSYPDLVNGLFEVLGGAFILLSILKLHREKRVRGVSVVHVLFFTAWGLWNCFFYPHLGQWLSFVGGLSVAVANLVWASMLFYYVLQERGS